MSKTLHDQVVASIRKVHDPEIPVNLYDLGLIYDLDISQDGSASIKMTLTTPNCPVAETLPQEVRRKVLEVDGVCEATVDVVWEPPWDKSMITDDGRMLLEVTTGMSFDNFKPPDPGPISLDIRNR